MCKPMNFCRRLWANSQKYHWFEKQTNICLFSYFIVFYFLDYNKFIRIRYIPEAYVMKKTTLIYSLIQLNLKRPPPYKNISSLEMKEAIIYIGSVKEKSLWVFLLIFNAYFYVTKLQLHLSRFLSTVPNIYYI